MKRLLLIIISLFMYIHLFAQETYVPDPVFEAYLETHDANGNIVAVGSSNSMGNGISNDNYVTSASINTVTFLDVSGLGIGTLIGIEDFYALEVLYCDDNSLTNLDVSVNTSLKRLYCSNNQILNLDISNNSLLEVLNCNDNQLTTLDISQNTNLFSLSCSFNNLNSINLNTSLINFDCHGNQLTNLDLSSNTSLNTINCNSNNLVELNVKTGNNSNFNSFSALSNNLTCIEVDNPTTMNTNWYMNIDNQTNFSTNCHFNETYIPDDIFEAYLETHDASGNIVAVGSSYSLGNGISNDNYVTTSNINTLTTLNISNLGIQDITGIEDFENLNTLDCSDNQLVSINLVHNTNLYDLNCSNNQISTLDTSQNNSLYQLNCSNNYLYYLGLNTNIGSLDCSYNSFTELNLNIFNQLVLINCSNNNLQSFQIKNGSNTNIYSFDATNNPQLTCIEVDNENWSTSNWINIDSQTVFSNDCNSLSVSNNLTDYFNLYPNPFYDNLNITCVEPVTISLINYKGQVITSSKIPAGKSNIYFSDILNGIYFLKIQGEKETKTVKLIKTNNSIN